MCNIIEDNYEFLRKCRVQHQENIKKRFEKKYPSRMDRFKNEYLLDVFKNRDISRKMIMKETDFLCSIINKTTNTKTGLNEQLKNFFLHKIVRDKDCTYYYITNESRKCFDRDLYCIKFDNKSLDFSTVNLALLKLRLLDSINVYFDNSEYTNIKKFNKKS